MGTQKQTATNGANAPESAGPYSPKGCRRSSRNARKQGILAVAVLIEGELLEEFAKFRAARTCEFNPQVLTEHALFNKVVLAQWWALHVAEFETAGFRYEMRRQSESVIGESNESPPDNARYQDVVRILSRPTWTASLFTSIVSTCSTVTPSAACSVFAKTYRRGPEK